MVLRLCTKELPEMVESVVAGLFKAISSSHKSKGVLFVEKYIHGDRVEISQ